MYKSFREFCERLLRIPPAPEPPPGDEGSTRVFRAAPNYYKYRLVIWGLTTLGSLVVLLPAMIAPLVGFAGLARRENPWAFLLLLIPSVLIVAWLLIALFRLAMVRLDFEKRWYVVTDRSFRVREGVVFVREMTVTFANIQNISISQGPIQRAVGIADLRVDTAGGGGATHGKHPGANLHTAWFRGIDNANEVRALIQQRLGRLKDSGLGDHDEASAPHRDALSPEVFTALREIHAESCALRSAVSRWS